jgi:hypothetical protein
VAIVDTREASSLRSLPINALASAKQCSTPVFLSVREWLRFFSTGSAVRQVTHCAILNLIASFGA